MQWIDLLFSVVGRQLPTDHSYPLYSALTRLLPCLHDGTVPFALAPIPGDYVGQGLLQLDPSRSYLRMRVRAADIPRVLPLAGKSLAVMGQRLRVGVPRIHVLQPSRELFARLVTFRNATQPEPFLAVARRELDQLNVGGEISIPEHCDKNPARGPYRRVMRIKDKRIVCFPFLVRGLNPDESLRLQETGLGGRRHMGCGLFIAVGDGEE